jgi:hypothetical protein
MSGSSKGLYKNVTKNDVQLASAYYPILVDLAKNQKCITYSELVEKAKETHLDNPVVKNAIAVSTGRKLDVVRIFTNGRNLPDLTSLIISKGSTTPGLGFPGDPKRAKAEVFAHDWSAISTDFDVYVEETVKIITTRKRRKKEEAANLRYKFFIENEKSFPAFSTEDKQFIRDLIDELLMEGFSPEEAFPLAVKELA